jgi:hypothetical protein
MVYVTQLSSSSRIRMELQFHPDPATARKLSANLYDMKHIEFHFQNKFEKLVHLVGFIIRKFVTMHGHMDIKFLADLLPFTTTVTPHY